MFRADEVVAEPPGLLLCGLHRRAEFGARAQSLAGCGTLLAGQPLQLGPQPSPDRRNGRAEAFQHAPHHAVRLLDEGQEQMQRLHLRMSAAAHQLLRVQDCLLRLLCEVVRP